MATKTGNFLTLISVLGRIEDRTAVKFYIEVFVSLLYTSSLVRRQPPQLHSQDWTRISVLKWVYDPVQRELRLLYRQF